MNPIKLSVVIITFNEEKNIRRCLQSLEGVADEIIVIDSHSTDNTEQICKEYQVRFYKKKWKGYSIAKNYGNSNAKYEYILSVDADEVLSDELRISLLTCKRNVEYDAYELNRLTNYCGKWIRHCGWYPEYRIRFWARDTAKWQGILHESLKFNKKIKLGKLEGDLLHYSFNSISDHLDKVDLFSEVAADEAVNAGFKVNLFYHIILNPLFTFVNKYIFKLGFLDGFYGVVICVISSFSNFLKYSKIRMRSMN